MPNIEMKSRYHDLSRAREIAKQLGGSFLWKDSQVDTYFFTAKGKLKLRESGKNGAELLPYIKVDHDGLKRSDYAKIPIASPDIVKGLFNELLGTRIAVQKKREVYLIDNVRIHLDEVKDLGNFLEFEAMFEDTSSEATTCEREKVFALMERFGLKSQDLLDCSYPDLLANHS